MDIDGVADELYGLAPEQFISTRTEREREARSGGDRELAARIRRLPKPTVVAWLANSLVRARRSEIEPLLELGAGLRAASATLDGDVLRELDRQQHRVVYALVQAARRLAGDAGRTVSEDTARALEDTLHAALADETAAGQLATGRLTDALHRDTGFPPAAGTPRLASVPTGRSARTEAALRTSIAKGSATKGSATKGGATKGGARKAGAERAARAERDEVAAAEAARKAEEQRRAAELELARRAEQRAQLAARHAIEARDRAGVVARRAEEAAQEAAAAVERLRAELDAATTEQSRLEAAHTEARATLEQTESDALEADRVLADATKERLRLSTVAP